MDSTLVFCALVIIVVVALVYGLYFLIKVAVKDAIRELDKDSNRKE